MMNIDEPSLAFTDSIDSLATKSIFGGISENSSTTLSCNSQTQANNYEINKKYLNDQNNVGVLHEDLQGAFPTPSVVDQLTAETARSNQLPLPSTSSSAKYDASIKYDSSSKVNSNKNPVIQLIRSKSKKIIVQLDDEQSDDENSSTNEIKTSTSSKKQMESPSKLPIAVQPIYENLQFNQQSMTENGKVRMNSSTPVIDHHFISDSPNESNSIHSFSTPSSPSNMLPKTITVCINQSPTNSTKENAAALLLSSSSLSSSSLHSLPHSAKNQLFASNNKTAHYSTDDELSVSSHLPPLRNSTSLPFLNNFKGTGKDSRYTTTSYRKNMSNNTDSLKLCVVARSAVGSSSSSGSPANTPSFPSTPATTANVTKLAKFKTRCSLCSNKGLTYCYDCNRVFCSSCWISIEHHRIRAMSPTHRLQQSQLQSQQQAGGSLNFSYHLHEGGTLIQNGGAVLDTSDPSPSLSSPLSSPSQVQAMNKNKDNVYQNFNNSIDALSSKAIAIVSEDVDPGSINNNNNTAAASTASFAEYVSEKRNEIKSKLNIHGNSNINSNHYNNDGDRTVSTAAAELSSPRSNNINHNSVCHHDAFVESILYAQQQLRKTNNNDNNQQTHSVINHNSSDDNDITSYYDGAKNSFAATTTTGFLSSSIRSYEVDDNHSSNDIDDDAVLFIRSTVAINQQSSLLSSLPQDIYIHNKIPINLNDAIQSDVWPINAQEIIASSTTTQHHQPTKSSLSNSKSSTAITTCHSKLRKPADNPHNTQTPLTRMTNIELKVNPTALITKFNYSSHNNNNYNNSSNLTNTIRPSSSLYRQNNNNNNNYNDHNKIMNNFNGSTADEAQFQKYLKLKNSMVHMKLNQQQHKYTVIPFDSDNNINNNGNSGGISQNNAIRSNASINVRNNGNINTSSKLLDAPLSLNGSKFTSKLLNTTCSSYRYEKKELRIQGKISGVSHHPVIHSSSSSLSPSASSSSSSYSSVSTSAVPKNGY